jgi:hypothetical protein
MGASNRSAWAGAALAAGLAVAGCGLPGAPLPPTLNLPQRVTDLSAVRTGNTVSLHWTMPSRNTDKLLLKGNIAVRVCRSESAGATCTTAGTLRIAPGTAGGFTETLPAPLAAGAPRTLSYFVALSNSNGRSAGLSNPVTVLAGQAPPAVTGLSAEMAGAGVVLHWNPVPEEQEPGPTVVRLERTLVSAHPPAKVESGLFAPTPAPAKVNLLVPLSGTPGVALDKDIQFGESYEYRAQRLLRVTIEGNTLELPSALSPPVRIDAINKFPPPAPTGLVAVATPAHDNVPASVDLSWQPDVEPGVGYVVYRRKDGEPWKRISPPQPVVAAAFGDTHVEPGQTYTYAVTAVSSGGLESARSNEAREMVPNQ